MRRQGGLTREMSRGAARPYPVPPQGKRIQTPTARWVFHDFVEIHVLFIPGQGLLVLNLTDEHQHLLQLLGKRYA